MTEDEMQQSFKAVEAFNDEIMASGAFVFAGGLQPPSSAPVVHSNDGTVTMTHGPYTETNEQLGGFWVIEAPDLDAALALATQGSEACRLAVEVRPFQDEPPA
jgi:hypothetical protein